MKILILDSVLPLLKKELEQHGFICEENLISSKQEIENKILQYEGIVMRSRFGIDRKFIDAARNLKFIAREGAGMEHIDVDYAEKKGIKCLSSPEGNRNAVAEHALGMLLNLMNNICKANHEVKEGKWLRETNRGTELEGKTIGIYGFGNTGSAFAKLLRGFDVKVLAYDKYKMNFGNEFVKESSPEEIFAQADIVSLHLPLTAETNYLLNDAFISKFKKNIYLINTSRGQIVKTDDLVKNMKAGRVSGACLDVLEYEETSFELFKSETASQKPEAFEYLLNCPKTILTPHVAGWSFESKEKLAKVLVQKIIALK
ncbi:MAG TPA: NAD(P)-dependent oxidoreductase [Bacteroidia bacterium]